MANSSKAEETYAVTGTLDNPFTALNKEEKRRRQEEEQRRRDAEKRAKEEQVKAERDAKKEEARLQKEKELAEKIKQRTEENDMKHQEEQKRKAEEKAAAEAKKQAEEERRRQEKEAALQRKKAEEEEKRRKKEEEAAEKKRRAEAEKQAAKDKREKQLQEEEARAAKRASEIAESRELQKRVEEAKKKGQLPENFIPIVWGLTDAERKEIEDILERPYWEAAQQQAKANKARTGAGLYRAAGSSGPVGEVVKSTFRIPDPWLEEKRLQQATVPWSGNLLHAVANLNVEPLLEGEQLDASRHKETDTSASLVEKYHKIVSPVKQKPIIVTSEKAEDTSLAMVSAAKSQAAALWAAIEKGEQVRPPSYTEHSREAFGKQKMQAAGVEEVIDLVAEMAVAPAPLMEDAQIAEAAKEKLYGTKARSEPTPAESNYGPKPKNEPASAAESYYGTKPKSESAGKPAESYYGTKGGAAVADKKEYTPSPSTSAATGAAAQAPSAVAAAPAEPPPSGATPKDLLYGSKASLQADASNAQAKYTSSAAATDAGAVAPSSQTTAASLAPPRLSESPYGPKAAVAARENNYGPKDGSKSVQSPYGTKPKQAAAESIYGAKTSVGTVQEVKEKEEGPQPTPSAATPVVAASADTSEYGSRIATKEAALNAMAGKASSAAAAAAAPAVVAASDQNVYTAFASGQPATAAAAAAPNPATPTGATPAAARPSLSQVSLTTEQIVAMVNQMTIQQQQQAFVMLKTAVSRGHALSLQQQQLMVALEARFQQLLALAQAQQQARAQQQAAGAAPGGADAGNAPAPAAAPASPAPVQAGADANATGAAASASPGEAAGSAAPRPSYVGSPAAGGADKRGLFFVLPKKQKFQFGIPGREIITLRHFDRVGDKKNAPNEKVLMVVCNDVAFVCKQSEGEAAGTYELFDKPTQRDVVTAEDHKDAQGFVLKLGKEKHTLIANSREEKLYWIQLINARPNFIPTDKLPEHAAKKAQAGAPATPAQP